jgi:hypothetical protein
VGAHRDPSLEPLLKNPGSAILYNAERILHPAVRVSRTGEAFFVPVLDAASIAEHAASAEHAAFMKRIGYRSKIIVAVTAQGRIFGSFRIAGLETRIIVDGSYQAPFGVLGRLFDHLVGCHIARASARDFTSRIAAHLEAYERHWLADGA